MRRDIWRSTLWPCCHKNSNSGRRIPSIWQYICMFWGLQVQMAYFAAIETFLTDFGGPQVLASFSLNVLFYLAGIIIGKNEFMCFSLLLCKCCVLNDSCLNMVHISLNNWKLCTMNHPLLLLTKSNSQKLKLDDTKIQWISRSITFQLSWNNCQILI